MELYTSWRKTHCALLPHICNMNTNGFSYDSNDDNGITASITRDLLVCKYSSKYFNQQFILNNNDIDFMLNELCVG